MQWRSLAMVGATASMLVACAAHGTPSAGDGAASQRDPVARASQPRDVTTSNAPVIAKLRTKDRELTVFGAGAGAGAGGQRSFLVGDRQGTTVAPRLNESELEEAFPELHELYETAFVRGDGIDASVDMVRFERDGRQDNRPR